MCDWATCNLRLHFSGTLLGSARMTGLLPVCGRNLYNWLWFWTTSDSEPEDSYLERKRRSFQKHNSTPFLWFFSPSEMSFVLHNYLPRWAMCSIWMGLIPHIRWANAPYNNDIFGWFNCINNVYLKTILERKRIPWSIFPVTTPAENNTCFQTYVYYSLGFRISSECCFQI